MVPRDALKSAQIEVTAMVLGERVGHGQTHNLPRLEPRADSPAAALTGELAAGSPCRIPLRGIN